MPETAGIDVAPATAQPDQGYDVFLSHNSRDKPAVVRLAENLKRAGFEPWLDAWCLTPGGRWQEELAQGLAASQACAVFVGPHDVGNWEREELGVALSRAAADPSFRLFLVLLPGLPDPFDPSRLSPFLSTRTWVDLRPGIESRRPFQALVCAVKGIPLGPERPIEPRVDVCPYRGLQTFDEEHAEFFFGREADVQRLVEKLKTSSFLAILGPSGSGKSSVARAGLLSALRGGALPSSEAWAIAALRPGVHPLETLTAHLVGLYPELSAHRIRDDLAADPRTLGLLLSRPPKSTADSGRVCLLVDQCEEAFTLCRDETERGQFLTNLLHAGAADGPATVVLTLRADFYARLAEYPELAQEAAAHQYLVGPLDKDGLRDAIEEPAHLVGLELEPGLVDQILDDVGDEPGALPLLEHTLFELWQRRRDRLLTLEAYRETGGVDGALAKRADETYARLGSEGQTIARRVLLRLTQPGEGSEDTRRRAVMSELVTGSVDESAVEEVVRSLADARLLTTGKAEETGERSVEVSHEALIRGWPRLRAWIDEGREGLRIHRQLTGDAIEWEAMGRDSSSLYRGARLAVARELAQDRAEELNPLERDFLATSFGRERRARRLRQAVVGLLVLLLTAAAGLAAFALVQRDEAQKQADVAHSRALAAESVANLEPRIDVALLLALEAYETKPTVEARNALVAGAQVSARLRGVLRVGADTRPRGTALVWSVAFSPDGKTVASGSRDGMIRLWNVASRRLLSAPLPGHEDEVLSVAFGPDGKTLASGSQDGTVRLWEVASGRPISVLRGHKGAVASVAFGPDGKTLASGSADRTIRLWSVASRRPVGEPFRGHRQWVMSVAFSPDGKMLASGSRDGTVRLWEVGSRRPVSELRGHAGPIVSVAFSRDGKTLASGSHDGTVRLWDVAARKPAGAPLQGHRRAVWSVGLSPDGKTLASGSFDGTVQLWDIASRQPIGDPLRGHEGGVASVAFSPDGNLLASGSGDGTISLWDAASREPLGEPFRARQAAVWSLAFSSDGKTLASVGRAGTIGLWDVDSGRPVREPLRGHEGQVLSVALSPDGTTLASGSEGGTVMFWDTASWETLGEPPRVHKAAVTSVAFSPDGKTLASGSLDGTIGLWGTASHQPAGDPLRARDEPVWSVAFSPDGKTLASGGLDGTVSFWAVALHEPFGELLRPHTGAVRSIAFSPDGTTLVSGSLDRSVRFWAAASRRPLGSPIEGLKVYAVAFSADSQALATGDSSGVTLWDNILWSTDLDRFRERFCAAVGRNLTPSEWEEFLPDEPYGKTCPQWPLEGP